MLYRVEVSGNQEVGERRGVPCPAVNACWDISQAWSMSHYQGLAKFCLRGAGTWPVPPLSVLTSILHNEHYS